MSIIKHFVLVILLLFLFELSSGHVAIREDRISPPGLVTKEHARKVLVDITQDYDYGGPNNKHEPPKRGKPGTGGKNP